MSRLKLPDVPINAPGIIPPSFTHPHTPIVHALIHTQRLGLRVGRTWAFNSGLPDLPGQYDEAQFEALDFVVYAAGRCVEI